MYNLTLPYTPEITRIAQIPRRTYTDDELEQNRQALTGMLKRPAGAQQLRTIQATALAEIGMHKGLFGQIKVGDGKTLISLLAPVVSGARRPLLLIRANLRDKTRRDILLYSVHWQTARWIRIESYEMLGRKQSAHLLDQYRPDMIIADEAHRLRNPKAAVTRRVSRWMRNYPGTIFVAMSGTMCSKSLEDYAHILRWTLGRNAPIPTASGELLQWCDVLDNQENFTRRMHPGAMSHLDSEIGDDEWRNNPTETARKVFRKRLEDTRGVVFSSPASLACPLIITTKKINLDSHLESAFRKLRTSWRTPDDWPISDGLTMRRHAYELALGFYSAWKPRPPDWWLEPRKAWCSECRSIIRYSKPSKNRPAADSESQVIELVRQGHIQSQALKPWLHVKDHWRLGKHYAIEARWISNQVVEWCARWMRYPGIVWTEHVPFAIRLARTADRPYYGKEGKNSAGAPIETSDSTKAIIASRQSNGEGRNLQMFSRNLIVAPSANAQIFEQLLGRTHRSGQTAHEVTTTILLGCIEHHLSLMSAMEYSKVILATMPGTTNMKLLGNDCSFHSTEELTKSTEAQWMKTLSE
jgi:hypothetical protein